MLTSFDKFLDVALQARQLLVVIIYVEQFQLSLEHLYFWYVRLYFFALFVEAIELVREASARLSEVTVRYLALHQLDLVHNVLIEVLDVHFHANHFGEAELPTDHALILVSFNLLDFSIDLREHLLERSWVIDLGIVGLMLTLDGDGLASVA